MKNDKAESEATRFTVNFNDEAIPVTAYRKERRLDCDVCGGVGRTLIMFKYKYDSEREVFICKNCADGLCASFEIAEKVLGL